MKRWTAVIGLLLLAIPAVLSSAAQAAPVPASVSLTDDWTAAGNSIYVRDPSTVNYRGKLFLFWEGDDPSGAWGGAHGNLFYRTYEDSGGVFSLGGVTALTPTVSPFGGEHRNEKVFPIVFGDRLFVVWSSADKATVPDGNVGWQEILVSSFDGQSWTAPFQVNAPIEPYNISQRGDNQLPFAAVLDGKLYIAWERTVMYSDNGTGLFFSDIWMRSFDGEGWSAPMKVSEATTRDYNEGTALGVYEGKLCIAWEQVDFWDPQAWSWKLLVRDFDGDSFGPVGTVASSTESGYKDSKPRLVAFDNPYTGRPELYLFWRLLEVPEGESALRAAVGYSVFDGSSWSPQMTAALITSAEPSATSLVVTSVRVYDNRIYLAWATSDASITTGAVDYAIAIRSFDGRDWGPITEATAAGDENIPRPSEDANSGAPVELDLADEETADPALLTPQGLPLGFTPLNDFRPGRIWFQDDPGFVEYKHRLYISWRTQPELHYYGWMTITLKVVADFDADGDGVPDTKDAFPDDPADWTDTDGDGVGDNTDPAPFDPDIWLPGQEARAAAPANPVMPVGLLLVGSAVAAFLLRPAKRASRAGRGGGN